MKKLLLLICSLFTLQAFAETDPKAAYALFTQGKAVIVDVREIPELKPGMVDGAHSFPLSQLEDGAKWKEAFLKMADGKAIFLYCRSGKRSEKARGILKNNGIDSENIGGFDTGLKDILPVKIP